MILLVASLFFYAWGEPVYILIMIFSTVFDFTNGLLLERFEERGKKRAKKVVLFISVAVNIGLLSFFKYADFVIENIDTIFGASISLLHIALPIGISFYTFQTLSYTIDVYRGEIRAQHNIISFGMYISMFPQLIAGPIVRYKSIATEIDERNIDPASIREGICRFIIGLSKKVLLANPMGEVWDEVILYRGNTSLLTALTGAVAFTLQIYFDFSGYSDMAIGIGRILGFTFPENFDHPYESRSITEFWRRWHMTLGTWFREYLYIPLGGNRKGLPRQILNLFIVWFLTGLWHGAGWNFILWGLYFFLWLVMEKLFLKKTLKRLPAAISHIYTMVVVIISWVIFACDDVSVLPGYLKSLFGASGMGIVDPEGLFLLRSYGVIFVIAIFLTTGFASNIYKNKMKLLASKGKTFISGGITAIIMILLYAASLIMVINGSYNPFLYFRF